MHIDINQSMMSLKHLQKQKRRFKGTTITPPTRFQKKMAQMDFSFVLDCYQPRTLKHYRAPAISLIGFFFKALGLNLNNYPMSIVTKITNEFPKNIRISRFNSFNQLYRLYAAKLGLSRFKYKATETTSDIAVTLGWSRFSYKYHYEVRDYDNSYETGMRQRKRHRFGHKHATSLKNTGRGSRFSMSS